MPEYFLALYVYHIWYFSLFNCKAIFYVNGSHSLSIMSMPSAYVHRLPLVPKSPYYFNCYPPAVYIFIEHYWVFVDFICLFFRSSLCLLITILVSTLHVLYIEQPCRFNDLWGLRKKVVGVVQI